MNKYVCFHFHLSRLPMFTRKASTFLNDGLYLKYIPVYIGPSSRASTLMEIKSQLFKVFHNGYRSISYHEKPVCKSQVYIDHASLFNIYFPSFRSLQREPHERYQWRGTNSQVAEDSYISVIQLYSYISAAKTGSYKKTTVVIVLLVAIFFCNLNKF